MLIVLITESLEEFGCAALDAADGLSSLKMLSSNWRIDFLTIDFGLPGIHFADAAREMRHDLKVLFITGDAGNATVGNGVLNPGMEILPKPFAMDQLDQDP